MIHLVAWLSKDFQGNGSHIVVDETAVGGEEAHQQEQIPGFP
jgi:hypothetical protein